jgi:hypothetical protein
MAKKESIHFRITKETKEKLYEVAQKENRKPNNWLENRVEKEHKKKK